MKLGKAIKELMDQKGVDITALGVGCNIRPAEMGFILESETLDDDNKEGVGEICKHLGVSIAELTIYALEPSDIAGEKREAYEQIVPAIKDLMKSVRNEVENNKSESDG